jgi:hypothetical protein
MKRFTLHLLVLLMFVLAACAPSPAVQAQPISINTLLPTQQLPPVSNATQNTDLVRSDEQGAVVFQVTPLNLSTPVDTLDFDVAMNTHSVDLSMDLSTLSTLSTDTGVTVQATKWDAPGGGHHVDGQLIFPAAQNGKSILEGASKLTLTIVKVDAASRVFEWELK